MAFIHIYFSAQTEYGSRLRSALSQVEDGLDRLVHARDTITFMVDGDGSSDAMFTEVTTRYGFPDNATAKAAWDELNSYIAKETTDATVDHVDAARKQLFNKLR
jgi:hypothetical protein